MSQSQALPFVDSNLLFGILAVQMDFISRDALIAAMNAWVLAKHRSLGEILVEQGDLTPERRILLDGLSAEHLKAHGDDVSRSVTAASHPPTLDLAMQNDVGPDAYATLTVVSSALSAPFAARPPLADGVRFQVLRPHATGGLGVVSVAHDTELGREVALKEIHETVASDSVSRDRFVREAEITGGLEHPGIVPVYGLGRYSDGRPYYAMRFVRGETLQDAVHRLHAGQAGYSLRGLLTRFIAVCNAVAYAHSRGVIHRDIKPSNVMLGPYGETLVVDWGLAKPIGRESDSQTAVASGEVTLRPLSGSGSHTLAGAALGTPAFMSPEQARGEVANLTPATDVYSLGATLYMVLTDRAPVEGAEVIEMLEKVWSGDWPPPRKVKANVPPPLEAICLKAMSLRTAERYRTPLDLAADLERWLADEPITAYRERLRSRAGRWVRRHRPLVAACVAAAVVGLSLLTGAMVWLRQEQARRRASAEIALARVAELEAKGRWTDARAALEQAEDRMMDVTAEDLRQRLDTARQDLDLVARLDELRLSRASNTQGAYDHTSTDRAYEKIFADAGLAAPDDDATEIGDRVGRSAVREPLVAALDDWALVATGGRRARALQAARRADPDPWRDRLRDPEVWADRTILAKTASEAPVASVTPGLAAAVGGFLRTDGHGETLLRNAQAMNPGDFWLNFFLASILEARGQAAAAEGFDRAALAVRPDSAPAHNNLGVALYQQHKTDEAIAHYLKAIELNPKFARPHSNLGVIYRDQNKLDEAAACFRKAIEIDPRFALAHSNLGIVLRLQGKLTEAAVCFGQAIELDPGIVQSQKGLSALLDPNGNLDWLASFYREAIKGAPRNFSSHLGLGLALEKQGKYDEAAKCYRKALELNPSSSMACNNLGWALHQMGKTDEGVALLTRAIQIDARNAWAHNNLGVILRDQGKLNLAAEHFEKAMELDPRFALPVRNLGGVRYRQGKTDQAEKLFLKAIEIDPNYPNARMDLAGLQFDRGQLDDAIVNYRVAVGLDPKSAGASSSLGVVLSARGREAEAAALYRKAMQLDPKFAIAPANLADVLVRQGKPAEAEAMCRKALQLNPDLDVAVINLAEALLGQARYAEAREAVSRALTMFPPGSHNRAEVEDVARQVELGYRLTDILKGKDRPNNAAQAIDFAELCRRQWRLTDAARLYNKAFTDDPKLASDWQAGHRFKAACAAALAACGNGEGAPGPKDKEREWLHNQARTWLRENGRLLVWRLRNSSSASPAAIAQVQRCLNDDDLAGVREPAGLTQLPESQRQQWEEYWRDLKALATNLRPATPPQPIIAP
jgi:tetratricopeptide (TPR) repeat protein